MDIKQLPDEDLAVYIREVDADSYREVVVRYERPLLRYAQFMLSNEIKAHELVQEAFIEAYKNINLFNPRQSFSNFLYRSVHNVLKTMLSKKHVDVGTYEELSEEFVGEDNTEQEFADKELLAHIRKHIHKLPVKYKETLVLHFFARKSYDEISEILQVPVSSVSVRIGLGKKLISRYAKN